MNSLFFFLPQRFTVLVDPFHFPRMPEEMIPQEVRQAVEAEFHAMEATRKESEKFAVTILRNRSYLQPFVLTISRNATLVELISLIEEWIVANELEGKGRVLIFLVFSPFDCCSYLLFSVVVARASRSNCARCATRRRDRPAALRRLT